MLPQLRTALNSRIVVEQVKGYLREHFDVALEDAFTMLRPYAHSHDDHLTDVSRHIISDPQQREIILATWKAPSSTQSHEANRW